METINIYQIEEKEYEIYQSASGDYCVSVSEYGKERDDYNLGSLENAYEFILIDYAVEFEEEEVWGVKIWLMKN